jgi:uncharacterized coiled-coil protein SlyX
MTDPLDELTELEDTVLIQHNEIDRLEKRLTRMEKYNNTLKYHLKAVVAKNTALREETTISVKR